jgi:anaerobic selenocysteine-containing dehydrogenase
MQARGVEEVYWRDYTAFPAWRPLSMEDSPPEYDLYLVTYKMMEFKESRSSHIPLLAELAPEQRLCINPRTARQRQIQDNDRVWVESHNAVTGEARRVEVKVAFTEGIRPDVVAMPHHYGEVARHPWARGQGPTPNQLYFSGEGYVASTQDQSYHVKVRVYKIGTSNG